MAFSLAEFVRRWKLNTLHERSVSQSHFIDVCDLLGHPRPAEMDAVGERFTFDKPVGKVYGGKGFADVWFRDHFAWEYKGKHKDLKAAYKQLNDYREDLGNPPLLVVCDLDRFEVHTNFTSTAKRVYAFNLDDLLRNEVTAACPLPPLEVLRALFGDYNVLRPDRTDARVTQEAAKVFARLAERLEIEKRALTDTPIHTKEEIAHFLMRLLFCLFADSIGLLPDHIFRTLVMSDDRFRPKKFLRKLKDLFEAMSEADSTFGIHSIKYFNGGLFDSDSVIELDTGDLGTLYEAAKNYNWAHVAPEIFGTLFERSLNKERRSLIGAHYTSAEDILLLIEPVVMQPLERRWNEVRDSVLVALEAERAGEAEGKGARQPKLRTTEREAERLLSAWIDELTAVRVLDPACGSGNFLYLALRRMLDLWKEAHDFAVQHDLRLAANYAIDHMVSPTQLYGIEIEFYAHELASIVVWIGYLQWKHEHGITEDREPILQKLSNIEHGDAILRYDAEGKAYEPEWPRADFIVGNPPFLGGKLLRRELGNGYVESLFSLYAGRVKAESDLVVYWFEKARALIEAEQISIADPVQIGLLATQGIRTGANRFVLQRIARVSTIFWAISDKRWTLDGASVRVSMIAFRKGFTPGQQSPLMDSDEERSLRESSSRLADARSAAAFLSRSCLGNAGTPFERARGTLETPLLLNGAEVMSINADLSTGSDVTEALKLPENANICFMGTTKVGAFELSAETAETMLAAPTNPNGRRNSDVVRPWVNALDVTRRYRGMYIVDFGVQTPSEAAAMYELPFEYVKNHVRPERAKNTRLTYRNRWWLFAEPRPAMRSALKGKLRFVLTPRVSKHRFFVWCPSSVVPDSRLFVFASDSDYFFGVLHSRVHEVWSLATSSRHGVAGDITYNGESCFDTFPFPWPPGTEPSGDADSRVKAIADAARELVRLRDAWLHPPGVPEAELKDRALTNLYNKRPEWLANAHRVLDRAVFAAYGWTEDPDALPEQELLARLLRLNHERAATQPAKGKRGRKPRKVKGAEDVSASVEAT